MSRVLFVSRAFGRESGGMERLSFELHANLSRQGTFSLIAYRGPRLLLPLFIIFSLVRVLWKCRRAQLLYLGDPLLSIIGWVAQRLCRIPVVVTVHGLDILYPQPLYQWYLRLFFRQFAGYVAISPYVKEIIKKWGVQSRCVVITPGVTDELFDPSLTKEDLSRVLAVDLTNRFILATIGRLVPRKGHVWFITHVLPVLPKHVLYVIAGGGKEDMVIAQATAATGQQDKVRILGRINEMERKVLFNTIDAFVQPNVAVPGDAEGFGLVLLEAALCQRPVFAARLEGIGAAIIKDKNGHLLESGNASAWVQKLNDYIAHPKPYRDAACQAREHTLAQFNWEHVASQYLDFFRLLIPPRNRGN